MIAAVPSRNPLRFTLNRRICDKNTNAELTLHLKLAFRQVNPISIIDCKYFDSNDNEFSIDMWAPSEWNQFKKNFVSKATEFWDKRFILINNHYNISFEKADEQSGKIIKYYPNVLCRINIEIVDAPMVHDYIGHHNQYSHTQCNSLPVTHTHDENAVISVVKPQNKRFRQHSHLLTNHTLDTTYSRTVDPRYSDIEPLSHVAAFHEIGHLIGLKHIAYGDDDCPINSNPNAEACYGTELWDEITIMGKGSSMVAEFGEPWRKGLFKLLRLGRAFSNQNDFWQSETYDFRDSIYYKPRTFDEVFRDINQPE